MVDGWVLKNLVGTKSVSHGRRLRKHFMIQSPIEDSIWGLIKTRV